MTIDWPRYHLTLAACGRVRCEPTWELGPAFSAGLQDFDLWYIAAGRGEMLTTRGPITLQPGLCLWMRPGHTYLARHDPRKPLLVNYIHFDLRHRRTHKRPPALPPELLDAPDLSYFDAAMARTIELTQSGHPDTARALLLALLMDFTQRAALAHAAGPTLQSHARIIHEVAAALREHPASRTSIQSLAENLGYSPDHFSRTFKKVLGVTPQEYALRIRIARARTLLRESDLSIQQIASALGYTDLFFFSRQFKRRTGLTPTACRHT